MRTLLFLGLLVACGPEAGTGAGSATDGAGVFARMCSSCHGPTGQPNATMIARLGVRDLTAAEVRARLTPALVEQQVRMGSSNKLMPGFAGALTDEQIKAVSEYVASPAFLAQP